MYSSLNAFPRSSFSTVSTPLCSEVHKKLGKPRYRVSFSYTTCHYGNNPVSVLRGRLMKQKVDVIRVGVEDLKVI